jgi:hypothetical protein
VISRESARSERRLEDFLSVGMDQGPTLFNDKQYCDGEENDDKHENDDNDDDDSQC